MAAVIFTVIVLAAASSGALFKPGDWYAGLKKPSWTPPNWAFPVVWTLLYLMIGYAGWLVWQEGGWSMPLLFWGIQIVVNAAWSWLFFGLRRMDLAFADVSVLWLSVVGFIVTAWSSVPMASLLFIPYLLWVTTAAMLNHSVWRLNPEA
ncbi:tryptophan-rich sensory protein [Peteryoungia desertarenae]|uniref:Tryptophan-rich sensory protein n=1 Tax=Peteryoungia desertarenae TaxID=1813451 RepID=A0ABX6QJJ0_9HYPH|nr:TspO/MBR family protein [Peteryoungia desertarenae]QLF68506.1 tryptophan-rich sensory protein [Peteryoungia desertarenae]